MKSIVFLTFDINGMDAFQKVIIFEDSTTLPGKETFGGVQKVFVLKTNTFRKSIRNYMNSQWFWNKKVFVFPMNLIDFRKMHDFKTNVF